MTQNNDEAFHKIMAQVQVYASSYSLVGTRFASDNQLEEADSEKLALYNMVKSALSQPPISQNEQQEVNVWKHFDKEYKKACESSQPKDWHQAAMYAQQVRNIIHTSTPKKIPEGWKLVQIDITPEMIELFFNELVSLGYSASKIDLTVDELKQCYKAMINAAPSENNTEVGG